MKKGKCVFTYKTIPSHMKINEEVGSSPKEGEEVIVECFVDNHCGFEWYYLRGYGQPIKGSRVVFAGICLLDVDWAEEVLRIAQEEQKEEQELIPLEI